MPVTAIGVVQGLELNELSNLLEASQTSVWDASFTLNVMRILLLVLCFSRFTFVKAQQVNQVFLDTSYFSVVDSSTLYKPLKDVYLNVLDSLSKEFNIRLMNGQPEYTKKILFRLHTEVVPNSMPYNGRYEYVKNIRLTDARNNRLLIENQFIFKDLKSLIQDKTSLYVTFFDSYKNIFNIMGYRSYSDGKSKETLSKGIFVIIKKDSSIRIDESLHKILTNVFEKYNINFNTMSMKDINSRALTAELHVDKASNGLTFTLLFTNPDAILTYENQPIQTEFQISEEEITAGDYSYLYGRLSTCLYKLYLVNF